MRSVSLVLRSSLLSAFLAAFCALPAQAAMQCETTADADVERCVVGLGASQLKEIHQQQLTQHWCWAASIAMVLRVHQLRVHQTDVAHAKFGGAPNDGATREEVLDVLNRKWKDELGRSADVSAQLVPRWRSSFGLLAPEIVADLDAGRPVMVGARRHATVLVQMVFERSRKGNFADGRRERLVRAVVLDSASRAGLRTLTATEEAPDFVMRVAVRIELPGDSHFASSGQTERMP